MPFHTRLPRWLINTGFVLALALTLLFAMRITMTAMFWGDPSRTDQVIEGWMPVGYVAHSWDIPREVLVEALDLVTFESRGRSLNRLAESRGIPLEVLIAHIMATIETYRGSSND